MMFLASSLFLWVLSQFLNLRGNIENIALKVRLAKSNVGKGLNFVMEVGRDFHSRLPMLPDIDSEVRRSIGIGIISMFAAIGLVFHGLHGLHGLHVFSLFGGLGGFETVVIGLAVYFSICTKGMRAGNNMHMLVVWFAFLIRRFNRHPYRSLSFALLTCYKSFFLVLVLVLVFHDSFMT